MKLGIIIINNGMLVFSYRDKILILSVKEKAIIMRLDDQNLRVFEAVKRKTKFKAIFSNFFTHILIIR